MTQIKMGGRCREQFITADSEEMEAKEKQQRGEDIKVLGEPQSQGVSK